MCINKSMKNSPNKIWHTLEWNPTKYQLEQFTALQTLLKEWNKKVNLTRLTDRDEYWITQILDSLWPLKTLLKESGQSIRIIDVGTGCGLPGLAIAIAFPEASLTLVDSSSRKTNAIKAISKSLGLDSRVDVRTERIEATGHNPSFRECFDFATARAVSSTPVVAEYLIPLLNETGEAIIYKGKWNAIDLQNLKQALIHLRSKIKKIESFELPSDKGERHLIHLMREKKCPKKYPRSIGIPQKRPLGT